MRGRRSSRSAFGQSTGNDVSGHYKRHYLPPPTFFPPSSTFLIEAVLGSKNLKVGGSIQKPRGILLSRPHWPFWVQLAAILVF